MVKRATDEPIVHGPWKGVRTVSDPYEERTDLLYDALNGYIPDPANGSGVSQRPPITVVDNPATRRYGQAIHDHTRTDGTIDRFVVRGGHLERWNGSLTAPVFTDLTPTTVQIAATGRVYLASFADRLIVNDGVNVPWAYNPATATATRISYGTSPTLLSRSTTDTQLAVASFVYTLSGATTTKAATPGLALGAGTIQSTRWGAWRVSISAAGTLTATSTDITGQIHLTEAAALAALPAVPAGSWDVGYITVLAPGFAWVPGTDALTGGATGHVATTTNYYAPATTSWTAYGQPVVYSAQLIFILNAVAGVSARTTITWSEIDDPLTGYFQGDFDNTWSLTQTSADPLTALAATNAALYYLRRSAIGEITGAISRTWRTEATLDAVSTSLGTTTPASVLVADDYVWFTSEDGLPHRFAVGGRATEPLWLNLRDTADAARLDATVAASHTTCGVAAYQPELRLVLMAVWCAGATISDTATILYAFSAATGSYQGRWAIGTNPSGIDTMGVSRDSAGRPLLCAVGPVSAFSAATTSATRGAFFVQRRTADISALIPWGDTTDSALIASITTGELLGDAGTNKRFSRLRARLRVSATALHGTTRRFQVTYDTPWATGLGALTPLLSAGVAEDRVVICGLATTARWLRVTITGPVASGGILTESGLGILTEGGLRLALSSADAPLLGPVVFEAIEVEARALGRDRVPA